MKGVQNFRLHNHDGCCVLALISNNCTETHPVRGVMGAFVFPLATIAQGLAFDCWQYVL